MIRIFATQQDLFHAAARDFQQQVKSALEKSNIFSVVLSGGNTPKRFFDLLANDYLNQIPWEKIIFFFGDERFVPMNDPANNFHMAEKYLFSKVPVNPDNIYAMNTDFQSAQAAAQAYEMVLRRYFKLSSNQYPPFDLIYLGLGKDAHTASLMPDSDIVNAYTNNSQPSGELVAAYYVSSLKMYRITLTPPAINHAKCINFLVSGIDKATAVSEVLNGKTNPAKYPAQLIKNINGSLNWYIDQAAAQHLTDTRTS